MKQNSVRAFGLLVIALFSLSSCKVLNGSSTGSAASTDANSPSITPAPPSNPSSDATLSTLSISGGTLSPSFSSGTTSYTATVPNATSSITITPGATNSNSTIQVRVNGGSYSSVTSGGTSGSLSLNVGTNTIEVLITAQDGTTHTYTITITRSSPGASTDATLASLSMASGGFLSSASVGFFEYLASFVSTSGITYTPTFDPAVTAFPLPWPIPWEPS